MLQKRWKLRSTKKPGHYGSGFIVSPEGEEVFHYNFNGFTAKHFGRECKLIKVVPEDPEYYGLEGNEVHVSFQSFLRDVVRYLNGELDEALVHWYEREMPEVREARDGTRQ
jgi:hypothetical protein